MTADRFLHAALARMRQIKSLGDGALARVSEAQLFHRTDTEANSIAIIVQHLHGNMLSRWTNFLTEDGDKPWRQRDAEFEPVVSDAAKIHELWQQGWALTLDTIQALQPGDITREVTIRGESMLVLDALIRQIGHYAYHVGQMVTLARQQVGPAWQTLSIARGRSGDYKPQQRAPGLKE
ncbi:MAG: DUF1572 family protein [Planctomycetes bacterium]|nr:DUF1572 family protein [Planctomycetota bacterium]MCW8136137.1 DUF1572 family protein [Planctomycetota bacterium]